MKIITVAFVLLAAVICAGQDWSAVVLYDGKYRAGVRYDVAALDTKGDFWISTFATADSDRVENASVGWGLTYRARSQTGVELGISIGLNAKNVFNSQKLSAGVFFAVGVRL